MSPIRKIIHAWSSTRAALSSLTVCPLNRSCSHFTKRPKNTVSWVYRNPNLTASHLIPIKTPSPIITHPLNCTCQSKGLVPVAPEYQYFYNCSNIFVCQCAYFESFDFRSSTYSSMMPYWRLVYVEKQPYQSASSKLLFMS